MEVSEVKDLIREVLQSDISEFELEHSGTRLKLKRGFGRDSFVMSTSNSSRPFIPNAPTTPAEGALAPEDSGLHIVTSPIVGTVYSAPTPGADSYVKLGDQVEEGTILCLVEAMKLMNEIPSDIKGEIARVYIENGRPVEFGQKLFGIRPLKQG
jgi:acetyl-CoA carboxylase biotin carboxyl carrier protein